MKKNRIDVITLGCSKNLVDSERLLKRFKDVGYDVAHDSDNVCGEIVVINTCGFIGDAKEESVNTILQYVQAKKQGRIRHLYVMGCLSQRYFDELKMEIPEVDKFYGKFDWANLISDLKKQNPPTKPYERILTTPSHFAYLKISEGCNRFCAFCAIPLITGRHTSVPMEQLLAEVESLVAKGVKEFNVIAQDLSSYGVDLYGKMMLPELIDRMAQIPGVEWIRLHYAYPAQFPYGILPVMARHDNVCKYLDIALQHISDKVLTNMRRHISKKDTLELIARLRREVPGIHIRTTLMVGFPGEGAEEFEELKEFVRTARFDRMGAFAYSEEEGTYGASAFTDDIPQDVKDKRLAEIMEIQEGIALELNEAKIGKTFRVIIDREDNDYFVGRTQFDSPEVDPEVLVKKTAPLSIGEFYQVTITEAMPFELIGTLSAE
ncbi:MAG: 30S ribosomal protein S12 methylthiotransferase RimO [Muribaculaceae bacterium]|jgi:ribosomal protein S12 methylthiotransferase|nr:30S ribosomal protein S12 methylthiotransferase RimO [Muribaculaceae bacterium]